MGHKNNGIFLSIIIPAYNEERRICETLEKVSRFLADKSYKYEIIVVDDGSKDRTCEAVNRFRQKCHGLRIISNSVNSGKGYSVKNGILNSKGEYVLFSDADLSTPIEEVEKLLYSLRDGCEVAIGSRALPDSDLQVRQPLFRHCMEKLFGCFVRLLVIGGIRDSQCGFKAFTRGTAREIFSRQRISGFSFDAELLFIAKKRGLGIKEVPVIWRNSRETKLNIFIDGAKMLIELIKIRINSLRGFYK
ncbi:MAG: glycosyltransferase family 2 protein [bacterium]|nr:glycosyltransferase family 2 protein [bacterium]